MLDARPRLGELANEIVGRWRVVSIDHEYRRWAVRKRISEEVDVGEIMQRFAGELEPHGFQ